jgi:hypothetical protein
LTCPIQTAITLLNRTEFPEKSGHNFRNPHSGFIVPEHYPLHGTEARIDVNGNRIISTNITCWFTNIDLKKRHEDLILYKTYNPQEFPKYDNYDAIEVSNTARIPKDYGGVMGVPVTFVNKYNPDQFEIIGATESEGTGFSSGLWNPDSGVAQAAINGKRVYKRLFIRNKRLM